MTDDAPAWDEERARTLPGKTILLGLTFTSASGEVVARLQRHGIIERVDPDAGVEVRFVAPGQPWDGELYRLPPRLEAIRDAAPGAYRLRATGETVVDPDFTSTWEISTGDAATPEQRDARRAEARRLGFPSD